MNRGMRLQNYQRTFLRVNPHLFLLAFVSLDSFASSLLLFFRPFFFFSFHPNTRRVDESFVMNENATYLPCTTRYVIRHIKGSEGTISFIGNIVVQYVIACYLSRTRVPRLKGTKWTLGFDKDPVTLVQRSVKKYFDTLFKSFGSSFYLTLSDL